MDEITPKGRKEVENVDRLTVEESMRRYYERKQGDYRNFYRQIRSGSEELRNYISVDSDFMKYIAEEQRLFEKILLGSVAHGERIADIGCGVGEWSIKASKTAKNVVSVDYTENMLAECRRYAGENGVDNIEYVRADCRKLPFPDQSFDGVISRLVLSHISERGRAFNEISRIVKRGGWLLVGEHKLYGDDRKETIQLRKMADGKQFYVYEYRFSKEELKKIVQEQFGEVELMVEHFRLICRARKNNQ